MNTTTPQPVAISVAVGTLLTTGVALAAVLIPDLAANQALQVALIAFGNSVIGLGVAVWTRARVTPVAQPTLPAGTQVAIQGTESTTTIPEAEAVVLPTPPAEPGG